MLCNLPKILRSQWNLVETENTDLHLKGLCLLPPLNVGETRCILGNAMLWRKAQYASLISS